MTAIPKIESSSVEQGTTPSVKVPAVEVPHVVGYLKESLPVTLGAFLFYFFTSSPFIGFGDTAILVDAIERGLWVSHVNNHPLTVFLGWVFSSLHTGEPAASANFLSVCAGSLAVGLWYLCIRIARVSRGVAIATTFPTVVMHSLWWHSTIIENYAITAVVVMATYAALLYYDQTRREIALLLACALAGFSITNHVQNGFLCIGVAVAGIFAAKRYGGGLALVLRCAGSACIGLLPWGLLLARDIANGPGYSVTIKDAFVGKFEDTFFGATPYSMVWDTLFVIWNQSPFLLLPLAAIVGVCAYRRISVVRAGILGILVHLFLTILVFSGYPTWDRFAFLLPAIVGLAVLAGIGLQYLSEKLGKGRGLRIVGVWCGCTALFAPVFYSAVVILGRDPSSVWAYRFGNRHASHLYDQVRFIADPNRIGYSELENFSRLLKEKLPHGALFLDDDSRTYYTLADYYQKYLGFRRDIRFLLVNSWGFSDWGLGSTQLVSLLEDAYKNGKPFFIASSSFPYTTFLEEAKKRFPVSLSPFPLGDGKWIYKLNTLPDGVESALKNAHSLTSQGKLTPVVLNGATGRINIGLEHVKFSSVDSVMLQGMSSFGPQWEKDNQLFANSLASGGEVELLILSNDAERSKGPRLVTLSLTTAPDFGTVEVSLNREVVGTVDLYSPLVALTSFELPPKIILEKGAILSLRVVGKNSASSGYKFGLDTVSYR
jgi:hypothetical protein